MSKGIENIKCHKTHPQFQDKIISINRVGEEVWVMTSAFSILIYHSYTCEILGEIQGKYLG